MAAFAARSRVRSFELALPWVVLAVILLYSYGLFFYVPYAGFDIQGFGNGQVRQVFAPQGPAAGLNVGDELVEVGNVRWADFRDNPFLLLFSESQPGQVVPIVVRRAGRELTINWHMAGRTWAELSYRLLSEWPLAIVFWLAGTATLLVLRPRDTRWRLLVMFNYLLALSLAGGSIASRWHLWGAPFLNTVTAWALAPVLLHLHWVFPARFEHAPAYVGWAGYPLTALLAVAELFGLLPPRSYLSWLAVAVAASLLLIVLRVFLYPAQRRALAQIGLGTFVAVLPSLASITANQFANFVQFGAALIALPALPGAYLYVAARGHLGGQELRANRLVAAYLFFVLVVTAFIAVIPLAEAQLQTASGAALVALAAALAALLLGVAAFAPFQHWVETRLLGVRVTRSELLHTLTRRITARLDMPGLTALLRETVLPSLFVRQAALLRLDDTGHFVALDLFEVEPAQMPASDEAARLLAQANVYRPPVSAAAPAPCPWVRLALPLRYDGKEVGLWLLGRLDPDDVYSQAEIANLQMLADQIALAMVHISQTERLRAFYQADADRYEGERSRLARDLHDTVLNELAALRMKAETQVSPLHDDIAALTEKFRRTIGGLRPAAVEFGLATALDNLADELEDRASGAVIVYLEVPPSAARYPTDVEAQVYRIVQQAAENALLHARPAALWLSGRLEPDKIELAVRDDGQGFAVAGRQDLQMLLAQNHFGLAGIIERAELIGADLQIDSTPGRGTRVSLLWQPAPGQP